MTNTFGPPPLSGDNDLLAADATELREQLRFELTRVKETRRESNVQMGLSLGFADGSAVSKWLGGHAVVSEKGASALDEAKEVPTVGGSFSNLRKLYEQRRRGFGHSAIATDLPEFDVFLASPMAAVGDDASYKRARKATSDVKYALETFCRFSVHYAGQPFESTAEFQPPEIAADSDFGALMRSARFVLFAPEPLRASSGAHVEAGFALAHGLPSLYIVGNREDLPVPLQKLSEHESDQLPPVSIQVVKDVAHAVTQLRKHGPDIFGRLDREASSRGRSR